MSAPEATALPLIDIARFRDPAERDAVLVELRRAAHEVGFFYVVGHGVPEALTDGMFEVARRFFALPVEDRLAIENVRSPQFRGYTRTGHEYTGGTPDWREQIDIGPERAVEDLGPGDPPWRRLIGPNQWPAALPELRETTLAWQAEALRVSREVLRALAAALGQDEGYFDAWFDEEAATHVKVVRYPGRPSAESEQGVGAHKDYGYLALLQQDTVGGLQVQAADGGWIDATPVPGSFVVNIGEMLEIATGGYLTATRHRVVSPPAGVQRYSVPFFLGPRLDAVVEPLELPADLAAAARGVSQDADNPLLAAYGENALVGWLRSHPEVARRWWGDVLAERG
ncbi:2-oxoglutarate and iron-dependent oxygenase domain-containing protein [Actinokineospora sp. NBRC 105648]|uniref:isopenicillin N synthase family dioxygenase n=1 Tax=Actinokineospora sp. NBRC 105648 TaxID=3032206 RepID=UPI0024A197A7|nr:2-oxoglutarate and iron-dependent oxygenase domain-containing protein [Actinokineospora sp. NBRC 105648]GLZ40424.1 2-oxobutyrate oxidase [Actinokineospora sp. NBRC 105648]